MGNMSVTNHTCPKPDHGMLPFIIHDAAVKGRSSEVMSWLEKGGDINASDMGDRTLVYVACEFNQLDLLKKLLKHPEVHINHMLRDGNHMANNPRSTPLAAAIQRGNLECAEALLKSPSLCQVSMNWKFGRDNISLIQYAGQRTNWKAVQMFLTNGYILDGNDAQALLKIAVDCGEIDIIKDILKQDFPVGKGYQYPFQKIYERNMWEETGIDALFKRVICKGNDSCKTILSTMLEKNDWKGLESLLKVINGAVEIHIDLAQAVKERKSEDVARLLSQEKLGNEVMNGTLLVASIGGTAEDIANMLLDQKYEYSIDVLNDSLILACLNNQVVLLPSLFQRESFNCTILDRAKEVARSTVEKLLDRAIKRVAKNIIPLEKDEAKETKDN